MKPALAGIIAAARRIRSLRDELRNSWVGLHDPSGPGHLVDWVLAGILARENVLLLGRPGVAKSEIAVRTFEGLGLSPPEADSAWRESGELPSIGERWETLAKEAGSHPRYFHYLLSRFTQPEELFGPVEISLLRQGRLVRVNFGLLTGPGVRAAFLDEIFKASSSILNTLLTLTQERKYFNWGGMMEADLMTLIGASNELPGGFGRGQQGLGSSTEDFATLHAFMDRFPIRLMVPEAKPQMGSGEDAKTDNLTAAFDVAIRREAAKFVSGSAFPSRAKAATIDDVVLLGRACLQHVHNQDGIFAASDVDDFRQRFLRLARGLFENRTGHDRLTWTISPRKLKALYKVALCHALICDDQFAEGAQLVMGLGSKDLWVFSLIWDSEQAQGELSRRVRAET
jgi:MoxR-like ATPase